MFQTEQYQDTRSSSGKVKCASQMILKIFFLPIRILIAKLCSISQRFWYYRNNLRKTLLLANSMNRINRSRAIMALIALVSVLFAQLAVAAYICPAKEIGRAFEMAEAAKVMQAMAEVANCDGLDQELPNLCQEHTKAGDQSLDKPSVPDMAAFSPDVLAAALYFITPASPPPLTRTNTSSLANSTAPPIAIRHCCFRI
jgi:hypothetical protein